MDPISAVSFAASVVQLVSFSISTAKVVYEVSQRGSSSDTSDTKFIASHLSSLISRVHKTHFQGRKLTKDERELQDVGKKCESIAQKLQDELDGLEVQRSGSRLGSVKVAAKTIYKKGKIEKMMDELERLRRILETGLLVSLREKTDFQTVRQEQGFKDLNDDLKQIINRLGDGGNSLAALLEDEGEKTRQHVTGQVTQGVERLEASQKPQLIDEVKDLLYFPEINFRKEQIDQEFDGIEESNQWIFNDRDESDVRLKNVASGIGSEKKAEWSNFTEWLRSSNGVYWISGKAGSGKSTLMNYVVNHERTTALLEDWSEGRQLITPSFFFWNSGTEKQKSVEGLLSSLIYQILDARSAIRDKYVVLGEIYTCLRSSGCSRRNMSISLEDILALTQEDVPLAICMFIDGLDEFNGEYKAVIQLVKIICDQPNIKVCISSRPLSEFESAFAHQPMLRLQDLTHKSIRNYVDAQLLPIINDQDHGRHHQDRIHRLMDEMVRKAEGVFLWIVLVVRTLRQGLEHMADLDEVEKTIFELPPGIEDLYINILAKIKPFCRRDAARYFQFILHTRDDGIVATSQLCALSFIESERTSTDEPILIESKSDQVLSQECRSLKFRMLSHTLGLLTFTAPSTSAEEFSYFTSKDGVSEDMKDRRELLCTRVAFFHRTLVDFLRSHPAARLFLENAPDIDGTRVHLSRARGLLRFILNRDPEGGRTSSWTHMPGNVNRFLTLGMELIREVEQQKDAPQRALMDSLYPRIEEIQAIRTEAIVEDVNTFTDLKWSRLVWIRSLDLIALASFCEMERWVSETLGIGPAGGTDSTPEMPYLCQSSPSRDSTTSQLYTWIHQIDAPSDIGYGRKRLETLLRWESGKGDNICNSFPSDTKSKASVVETFLLRCCVTWNSIKSGDHQLIADLLSAGADPMARMRINPAVGLPDTIPGICESYWDEWIESLLNRMLFKNLNAQEIIPPALDPHCWNATRMLLTNGADINHVRELSDIISFRATMFKLNIQIQLRARAGLILRVFFKDQKESQSSLEELLSQTKQDYENYLITINFQGDDDTRNGTVILSEEDRNTVWRTMFEQRSDQELLKQICVDIVRNHQPSALKYPELDEAVDDHTSEA